MRIIIAGTENILWNMYNGSQKSMLITNCIFRWGGFAALLSNHPADRFRAKYKLQHVVRTHLGSNEDAYKCVVIVDCLTKDDKLPLSLFRLSSNIRHVPNRSTLVARLVQVHGP